jgi:N-acetylmuramoyl-L-alanine amidase
MPAILIETGFIDSDDVNLLTGHGDDIARAIARGVTDYWQQSC